MEENVSGRIEASPPDHGTIIDLAPMFLRDNNPTPRILSKYWEYQHAKWAFV